LCSYLLIGFYFTKKFATDAGNKAFWVNRIGDFGFILAIFLIGVNFATLDFGSVFAAASGKDEGLLTAIALLLFLGACGKSAQIPLYVWLPDAMAGPTPVSALIHAATMVTAGVYMVARSSAIYVQAPEALDIVALIGLLTAVLAATIALAQNDIKKVFAYSTVSQLGYMFLGLGVGAFSAGIYHLMTHAFFKALLFLGAGSVIHALSGEQDLQRMGGLRKKIPLTFWTMMAAGVAIAGVPPFSGYFSKDAILIAAHHHSPWMYWVGVITAGMTAFYVFRAIFLAFFGEYRGDAHPHESPPVMTIPLVVLAIGSLGAGFLAVPTFLGAMFPAAEEHHDLALIIPSVAAGLIGITLAYLMYVAHPGLADRVAAGFGGFYRLVQNKYLVDEAYDAAIVQPLVGGSREVLWKGLDAGVIDGAVNGIGARARGLGSFFRLVQSGNIRSYATWIAFGSVLIIVAMGIAGGIR
jgi:NADH-quinone oxidoreductase subunit L